MKRILFGYFFFFSFYLQATPLVLWGSDEAEVRFNQSRYKKDFFHLSNNFESQSNITFCGPTSAAIVLNSLRIGSAKTLPEEIPLSEGLSKKDRQFFPKNKTPFLHRYTQFNIFNAQTNKVKTEQEILGRPKFIDSSHKKIPDFGLQINELAEILRLHKVKVEVHQVMSTDKNEINSIRTEFKNNLTHDGDFIIVNFYRKSLGQNGGGHFSPVAAYDEKTDSFLIMDVNPLTTPWFWVSAEDLVKAMADTRTDSNREEHRGYIIVKDS